MIKSNVLSYRKSEEIIGETGEEIQEGALKTRVHNNHLEDELYMLYT